jgi:hypothetical protein
VGQRRLGALPRTGGATVSTLNKDLERGLDRWTEQGLITPEQRAAIVAAEASRQPEGGLRLTTVATYFGGFLILFAYTVFWGTRWSELTPPLQAGVALATMLVVGGVGVWLRRRGERLGGDLLIFAATGILPLFIQSVMRATGLWPEAPWRSPDFSREDYWRLEARAQGIMTGLTVAGTLAVYAWSRFPLLLALAGGWGWFLTISLARLASDDSTDVTQLATAGYGLALVAAAFWLRRREGGARSWSAFWLTLVGLFAFTGGLGAYALGDDRALAGLLFLVVHLGLVWLSVRLGDRLLLVFGALGIYLYIGKLALDTFRDSLGFPLALAIIGLSLVLGAVAYSRFADRWRGLPPPSPPLAH